MIKYKIGFGIGGSYGGISDFEIHECKNEDDAMDLARELAVDYYQMYEGVGGLMSWGGCQEALMDEYGEEPTDDEVEAIYNEEVDSWLCYEVKVYDENEEHDDEF